MRRYQDVAEIALGYVNNRVPLLAQDALHAAEIVAAPVTKIVQMDVLEDVEIALEGVVETALIPAEAGAQHQQEHERRQK